MPRLRRIDAPDLTHHVTIRGIDRRDIFEDHVDRLEFLRRLRRELAAAESVCLSWALMSNHVHLVLRTGATPLSTLMQRLNGGYARAFNRRHGRRGYVLEDRFHSSPIGDDAYRSVAVRYVLLNPIRAKIVPSVPALATYPWTGYPELAGTRSAGIIDVDQVLAWLAPAPGLARVHLPQWMESALGVGYSPRPGDEAVVRRAQESRGAVHEALADREPLEVRAARRRSRGWTLDVLIAWVAEELGVSEANIRAGRRSHAEARARAVIASLAATELAIPGGVTAAATGVTSGAISHALRRTGDAVRSHCSTLPLEPPEKVKKSTSQLRSRVWGGE